MLFMQNIRMTPHKSKKKSKKKRQSLKSKIFNILFKGIEMLWRLLEIIQYILQIFKQ